MVGSSSIFTIELGDNCKLDVDVVDTKACFGEASCNFGDAVCDSVRGNPWCSFEYGGSRSIWSLSCREAVATEQAETEATMLLVGFSQSSANYSH